MRFVNPVRVLIAAAATAAATVVPSVAPAAATTVPFSDPNVSGYIGLCNEAGRPITSGSLLDDPFVWTAVSSSPAPSGYRQGRATLYVFQPRKDVDPGGWSGQQVTGSSGYTNPYHPMVQATSGDAPLISVDGAFPPRWDGLYQLRMYFTGVNLTPYTQSYPATVIQVSGDHWRVVQGGTVACNSGRATSNEVAGLNRPSLRTPGSPTVTPGAASSHSVIVGPGGTTAGATTGARSGYSTAASTTGSPSGSDGVAPPEAVGVSASKDAGMSKGPIVGLALIGLAVVAGGTAGLTLWRRRRTGGPEGGPVPTGR